MQEDCHNLARVHTVGCHLQCLPLTILLQPGKKCAAPEEDEEAVAGRGTQTGGALHDDGRLKLPDPRLVELDGINLHSAGQDENPGEVCTVRPYLN